MPRADRKCATIEIGWNGLNQRCALAPDLEWGCFRFFGCVTRCNECAPCAINRPARLSYSAGYEAILSRKGNYVATTPLKALVAFFLFLRDMTASTLWA